MLYFQNIKTYKYLENIKKLFSSLLYIMPFNPPASNTQTGNGSNLYALANGGGSGGVSSLNTLIGDVALTSTGNTVTITEVGQNINLEASGGVKTVGFQTSSNTVNVVGGVPTSSICTVPVPLTSYNSSILFNGCVNLVNASNAPQAVFCQIFSPGGSPLYQSPQMVVNVPANGGLSISPSAYFAPVTGTGNLNFTMNVWNGTGTPISTLTWTSCCLNAVYGQAV